MKIQITSNTSVYNFCEPYIIAELGANHNGDMELAKQLISRAKEAGCNCVKFQSWSKETIFSQKVYQENFFLKDDYRSRTDYTLEQIVEKFSISEAQLLEMKHYADSIGIDCISTPFSRQEVDFLTDKMKSPFIKIASMDVNNYPFLEYIAKKGLPVVLATGLSTLAEIDRAIDTLEKQGNKQIIILHCVSMYPPKEEEVNLNNIETFQKMYPYPIGFSDHTIGFSIPLAAVAKGACMIEKHFTLDKTMFGWDHKISADFNELKIICQESKKVNKALGQFRIGAPETAERKNAFRRSIVAARNILEGEIINREDLDFKRPGTGIVPGDIHCIVGKKAKRNIDKDQLIEMTDF
jgi:N-acetylneuraminate synthase